MDDVSRSEVHSGIQGEAGSRLAEEARRTQPNLYWYLSFRCNLACQHCSVNASPRVDTSSDLTTRQALEVVEQIAELGAGTVNLTGGETLLRRDTVEILEALGERCIRVSLETNGLVFTDRFLRCARRLQEEQLLGIGISLDGGTAAAHEALRGKHTFDRTLRGLRRLCEEGIYFGIQATLNRQSFQTLPQLYRLAQEYFPHLRTLSLATLNPVGRGDELSRSMGLRRGDLYAVCELVKRQRKHFDGLTLLKVPPAVLPPKYLDLMLEDDVRLFVTCQFPLLGILPNGDVTICALTREDGDLYLGNVSSQRLQEIWQRAELEELRRRYLPAEDLQGICADCVFRRSCKGGCRAWAYETGGSFEAPHPVCAALEEAGAFPDVYRLSRRQALLAPRRVAMEVAP